MCDDAHKLEDVVMVKSGHDLHLTFKVLTDLVGNVLLQHLDSYQLLTVRLWAVQFSWNTIEAHKGECLASTALRFGSPLTFPP